MKKKWKIYLLILLSIFLFASFTQNMMISVNAANKITCKICGKEHDLDELDAFRESVYEMTVDANSPPELSKDLEKALKFDTTSGKFADLWTKGKKLYNILAKTGEIFCLVYALLAIIEQTTHENITNSEHILKMFIKLFLGIIIIRSGFDILEALMGVSSGIYDTIKSATDTAIKPDGDCYFTILKDASIWETLGCMFKCYMPNLAMFVAKLTINVICWSRVLELMVRVMFAPIGIADIMQDGTRSNGFRYLKKILSCALKGAVMLTTIRAYSMIRTAVNTAGGSGAMLVLVMAFSLISILHKSGQIADDALGV